MLIIPLTCFFGGLFSGFGLGFLLFVAHSAFHSFEVIQD